MDGQNVNVGIVRLMIYRVPNLVARYEIEVGENLESIFNTRVRSHKRYSVVCSSSLLAPNSGPLSNSPQIYSVEFT